MSTRKAFEDSIQLDRYDQVTRLVFADWLEENGCDDEALVQRSWTREKQEAIDYLTEFAEYMHRQATQDPDTNWYSVATANEVPKTYAELLAIMDAYYESPGGEGIHWGGMTPPTRCNDEEDKLWDAYSVIRGKTVPDEQRWDFFTCSC